LLVSDALTSYAYGEPGVFGGPALDRVGNLDSQPDGYPDSVGIFNLTVAAVPEPSTATLWLAALSALLVHRRFPLPVRDADRRYQPPLRK
jgi:hypothetical protein